MSLKRIAEIVGVSPATVSRVLNNSYRSCASKEVKDKIWEVAREINYVPNIHAKNLKKGEQLKLLKYKIAIVLARIEDLNSDPFFYELYREIENELFSRECIIHCLMKNYKIYENDFKNIDGIIILGRCSNEFIDSLQKITNNLVGIWRNSMNFKIDEIICDGEKASSMALEYLIKLGHRKIGYIGDCSYESRYLGYYATLMKHNIPIDYSFIIQTHQTEEEGYNAMINLIYHSKITSVLCANDITAIGALKAIEESKRKISVISIDNIEQAQLTEPLLTTINIPKNDMAHMAVNILFDRIQKKHNEKIKIEFPCKIIERESCDLI